MSFLYSACPVLEPCLVVYVRPGLNDQGEPQEVLGTVTAAFEAMQTAAGRQQADLGAGVLKFPRLFFFLSLPSSLSSLRHNVVVQADFKLTVYLSFQNAGGCMLC